MCVARKIAEESNFSWIFCFVFSATSIVRSRPLRENPIPVAREKSISHSSTSSNEENIPSSGSKSNSAAAANLVDPYSLISKTSASEFRKNNDSISSNTTNEDIDEDEDFNYCDSNEQQVRFLYFPSTSLYLVFEICISRNYFFVYFKHDFYCLL